MNEKALEKRDASRDIGKELLESVHQMKQGLRHRTNTITHAKPRSTDSDKARSSQKSHTTSEEKTGPQ